MSNDYDSPSSNASDLVSEFSDVFQRYADQSAFSCMQQSLSYGQLDDYSLAMAHHLQQRCQLGDRVCLMMPNILQYPIALFAVLRAGLVVVNINPLYTATELAQLLKDAKPRVLVVLDFFADTAMQACAEVDDSIEVIVTHVADCHHWFKRQLIQAACRWVKRVIPKYRFTHQVQFRKLLQMPPMQVFTPPKLNADSLAMIQYTGGTTGTAKGAMLTHGNIMANIRQCHQWMETSPIQSSHTALLALPLYHIFSLTVGCFSMLSKGVRGLLVPNPRDTPALVKLLTADPVNIMLGINTLFQALLHQANFDQIDWTQCYVTVAGGMAMQESVANTWCDRTGCVVIQGYGLTEASPVVSINAADLKQFNLSIGRPVAQTDIKIHSDALCQEDDPSCGELWVRGPQVMQGYWGNAEATQEAIDPQGWLKTGDIAKWDDDGLLHIVDRKKDMIIVSGFNVYPNEVEGVLSAHDAVAEVAVIGIKDQQTGERVVACIVLEENHTVTDVMLTEHCRAQLAAYKVPKQWCYCDALPKSPVGKVLRRMVPQLLDRTRS